MPDSNSHSTRRSVLKTVGGALGVASVTGLGAAEVSTEDLYVGQCVVADGEDGEAPVFDSCGSDIYQYTAENGTTGTVDRTCEDLYGTEWGYIYWDDDTTDGWVPESALDPCTT